MYLCYFNIYLQENGVHAWKIYEFRQTEQLIDDATRFFPNSQLAQILTGFVQFSI